MDNNADQQGREETVRCLLLFGDQAELTLVGGDQGDVARWPADDIVRQTGLEARELPGKEFRAHVSEHDGNVVFSGFRLA